MNKTAKVILGIFGGLALTGAGFGAGYYFGVKRVTKRLDSQHEDDLEAVRNIYRNKLREAGLDNSCMDKDVIDIEENPSSDVEVVIDPTPAEEKTERKATIIDIPKPEPVEEEEHERTDTTEFDMDWEAGKEPYLITCDEYGMDEAMWVEEWTCANLYWRGGMNLVDEAGASVDIASTIGFGAIDELAKHGTDDPYVYVRNPRLKIDYEVAWDYLLPKNAGTDHPKEW